MRLMYVPMIVQIIAFALHVTLCYLLVVYLQMDIIGIVYAFTITSVTELTLVTAFPFCIFSIRDSIILPYKETWKDWPEYLRLMLPSVLLEFS